ncbi:peptidase C14 caspase catalytic subunit p20 [Rhizobium leguminosarum bv. trifolii WSM1325]|uniref:Peptidase C14 caspase catalytic subunit p20 n=1 Tax=Rhizobium leguminosarum bv. trifolii (strain WSM1325) TaxID=395491 RepID=C6AVN4_RHILS|nr:caspase family protein [Rhizobium leguminosarum]ACS55845.1 peptidase C14 caspase catalytic subunit p20 [Rhizobium leguminosarum bv. trifolii WSM1325]
MNRKMAALVIGVADYSEGNKLANPVHDAVDLGDKLRGYGFEVIVVTDCTKRDMDKQLKEFRTLLETHDVGLFFFAGHGMQIDGTNFLLATDTEMDTELDAKHTSLSLDRVVDVMAKSAASTKIIVLDACRNNPWERAWHRGPALRGLASVYAPKGTIIGFATSPGEVALDGAGRNGTYTEALLEHIDTPDSSIETMFKRVRNTVAASSGGRQTTWEHTSLSGEFYFNLSLGNLVDEYDGTALADSLFVLDPGRKSHNIIAGLKTYNWYKQNPALDRLDAASANKMSKDNLFVLGRNIYQAACGSAGSAITFIDNFMDKTRGFNREARKSLLDGILFEVFFDSQAHMRDKMKRRYFNEVFELQRFADLKQSFDFIAEVLTTAAGKFYALPGKGHDLAVSVSTKSEDGMIIVDAVYVGGVDVLRREDDNDADEHDPPRYWRLSPQEIKERLSEELVVPTRLLKLTFTPGAAVKEEELGFPMGWTVRQT